MKRRDFLLRTALGTSFALLGPLRAVAQPQRDPAADARARWAELLDYARWSPSPHNVQPWKLLVLSDTAARLYYDPTRLLPHTDPTSCFTIIGLGMFIESLRIAAGPLGFEVVAQHTAEPGLNYAATTPQPFADLHLVLQTSGLPVPNRELLKQRRTSRLHYNGRPVAAHIQQQLAQLATAHGHELTCSDDPAMVDFILDLNRQTLFTDLDEVPVRQELAGLIRTTDEQAHQQKDGLWSHCMGFPGRLMHNFFFHSERFRSPWKRGRAGQGLPALYARHGHGGLAAWRLCHPRRLAASRHSHATPVARHDAPRRVPPPLRLGGNQRTGAPPVARKDWPASP